MVAKPSLAGRVSRKAYTLFSTAFFSTVGRLINNSTPYMVQYRPDFHKSAANFSEYKNFSKAWMHGNARRNGGDYSRFYMLYQNVKQVLEEGVEGDIAELGVFKGNSAFMLSKLAAQHNRSIFLLDTFAGFDERDFKNEDSNRASTHFSDTSLGGVQRLVGTTNSIYVVGYFPQSVEDKPLPEKFSVVHLDADLYEPMKAGLEYFYSRVSPGGAIIMHDYASGEWPGTTRAVDEFFRDKVEKLVIIPDKSGTAVNRRALAT